MILHIDMDAFFASIEQAVNQRLKGKPLIVGSRNNRLYTVVCAASYEAKALGIDSGMPSREAFNLCPNLEFVAADQDKYIWTLEQLFEGLGIKTCLDLYQKSPQFLEQNLGQKAMVWLPLAKAIGQNGLNLYLSLHSNDHFDPTQEAQEVKSVGQGAMVWPPIAKSIGHSYNFTQGFGKYRVY